jgi:uncharacterized protein
MASKRSPQIHGPQPYRYRSPNVPLAVIRRHARRIAERFHPEKIILFGSYAYGKPHAQSDVDLLVIMPTHNAIDQAVRIDLAFKRPFSLDVHVRTPFQIKQGLKEKDCDWFLREVMEKGKVLYEAPHGAVGEQGRRGHNRGKGPGRSSTSASRRRVLSLPAGSGKVLQSSSPGTRRPSPKNP